MSSWGMQKQLRGAAALSLCSYHDEEETRQRLAWSLLSVTQVDASCGFCKSMAFRDLHRAVHRCLVISVRADFDKTSFISSGGSDPVLVKRGRGRGLSQSRFTVRS